MGKAKQRSSSVNAWNKKLSEIVKLAGELKNEDQKLAAESLHIAVQHIESLFKKSACTTFRKKNVLDQVKPNEENTEVASSPVWKRRNSSPTQTQTPSKIMKKQVSITEPVKVKRTRNVGKKTIKPVIQETQPMEEINSQKMEDNEVQSVQLMMFSSDPVKPNLNMLKKVSKNESTGKIETIYQCQKCSKKCLTAKALHKHWSSHSKSLECSICHQKLCSTHALNAHKRTHTGERPYECIKCSSTFTTRGNLCRHLEASHEGKKPWQCTLCGRRYTEKKSLKVHMRTHTGEKPFECSVCHKKFSQSSILQAHMLTHSNQYEHLCDICGRSFRQRSQLMTHNLRHQGVRPFSCPNCDRSFTTKGDLDRHIRTHTGERPFRCDVCGSSFARHQTLQDHRNRHFNFKPYMCKICGKMFHEMSACSRHIKGLHSREKECSPPSANVLRIPNPEQPVGEEWKPRVLITRLDVANAEGKKDVPPETPQKPAEESDEMEIVKVEEVEDVEEGNHHILVMHTTEAEETQMITIAEPTDEDEGQDSTEVSCEDCATLISTVNVLRNHGRHCTGVSCEDCRTLMSSVEIVRNHVRHCKNHQGLSMAEWLIEDSTINQDSNSSTGRNSDGGGDGGSGGDGSDAGNGNLDQHTVTISEDVTITSLPLTQLPPIHLQLESDYMVVLRESDRNEQTSGKTLRPHQVQVEDRSLEVENSQPRLALVSSLLSE